MGTSYTFFKPCREKTFSEYLLPVKYPDEDQCQTNLVKRFLERRDRDDGKTLEKKVTN
jgi:hypothetical protein